MDNGFLGTGWRYGLPGEAPGIALDAAGRSATAGDDEKIRQSIWILLGTARGERIGRPDFGCGVHDLVFASRTAGTMGDVMRAVREAINLWEPRVDVIEVDARPHPDAASGLLVEIVYQVRATNSRQNLVYPFYLAT